MKSIERCGDDPRLPLLGILGAVGSWQPCHLCPSRPSPLLPAFHYSNGRSLQISQSFTTQRFWFNRSFEDQTQNHYCLHLHWIIHHLIFESIVVYCKTSFPVDQFNFIKVTSRHSFGPSLNYSFGMFLVLKKSQFCLFFQLFG